MRDALVTSHSNPFVTDPAKVTFTPTVQYLPFRLGGVVQCYIKANPPLQYVTWTKERRLLEPYQTKDIVIMNNGSLLFTRVNEAHGGRYSCTPYNAQGTQGSSGPMEVLVRKPPFFTVEPEALYQRKVSRHPQVSSSSGPRIAGLCIIVFIRSYVSRSVTDGGHGGDAM